ncbi:MAG: lamin tail domain-containing protein [Salinivirgaceae bacterium]|nr:lamin tail domain-containing protein [Salinivirgaceae bacterium]
MKKILLLFSVMFSFIVSFSNTSDLIISEYIEGSNFNKAIELYNGTGETVDLSNYILKKASNGGDWTEEVELSGSLNDGDVFVISRNDADAAIVAVTDFESSVVINFNGNDAVGLFKNGILIDVIGNPNLAVDFDVAGITAGTKDHTLVRKSSITNPNNNWEVSAGTNTDDSEWIVYNKDDFNYIGFHSAEVVLSDATDILSFNIEYQLEEEDINAETHTVDIKVLFGTDISNLIPIFTISDGALASPSSGVAQNFSAPFEYLITAEDGTTTQIWTVTVNISEELSTEAEILTFVLTDELGNAEINSSEATIYSIVPWDTDLTTLTPVITISSGAQITPTVAQDFSAPVVYTVTAQDGTTIKEWTVTVVNDEEASLISIHDIQFIENGNDSPYLGQSITTKGVVAAVDSKGLYLQDGEGAWNGVYVYKGSAPEATIGDSIIVAGDIVEYLNLTEILNPVITVLNSDNLISDPVSTSIAEFKQEKYEGVLVNVSNVICVGIVVNNNWKIADSTNDTLIVRNGIFVYEPELGQVFTSIIGFSGQFSDDYQLFPRSASDVITSISKAAKLENIVLYPNPVKSSLIINNIIDVSKISVTNIIGKLVFSENVKEDTFILDVSQFKSGIYVVTFISVNGETHSKRIIVE